MLLSLALSGCGFRSAREAGSLRVSVEAGVRGVPEAALIEGAVLGARRWLAGQGALSRAGYPRLEVSVGGFLEESSGVVARGGELAARGVRMTAWGEGFFVESPGAAPTRRTGEVRVSAEVAREEGLMAEGFLREEALQKLGVSLGEAVAARVWGHGAPLVDRMW